MSSDLRSSDLLDPAAVAAEYQAMEIEAGILLAAEGFSNGHRKLTRSLDVRYAGQEHSVTVSYPDGDFVSTVEESFAVQHLRHYGHTMTDPVEITTLRLRATGVVDKPILPKLPVAERGSAIPNGIRPVYLSEDKPDQHYSLYTRESLLAGDEIAGPAVISEHTATTVLNCGDHLRVGGHGELVITVGAG